MLMTTKKVFHVESNSMIIKNNWTILKIKNLIRFDYNIEIRI